MKNILLSSAVIALLSTTAMAGTVVIGANVAAPAVSVAAINTAAEGIAITSSAGFDLDPATASPLGTSIGRAIVYSPGITLNDDDTFTLEINGATLSTATNFLLVDESEAEGAGNSVDINGDGDDNDIVEVAQQIGTDADGNPVLRIVLADGLTANTHMVLTDSDAQVSNGAAATLDNTDNPTMTIDASLVAGSTVTLRVKEAKNGSGSVNLTAADTALTTLFTVENQINVTFGQGTSTIDVNNARTQFLEEGAVNDIETSANDTDLLQSSGTITFDNDSDSSVTDFIADAELNTLTLALTDTAGFESVDLTASSAFDDNDNTWSAVADGTDSLLALVGTDAVATLPTAGIPVHGTTGTEDIILDVDGSVLKTRTVSLLASLDFANAALTDVSANDTSFITWDINGYQASIQDVRLSSTYNTGVTLYNNHPTLTAEVEVTAIDSKTGLTLGTAALKDIKPNSRQAIAASVIETKIPAAAGKTYRADLTTTIPTASGDSDAWQLFKGASIRTLPVADNNAGNDANNDK